MKLSIADLDGEIVKVVLSGKVTQLPDSKDPFHELLGPLAYSKRILLDMEAVTYIDSSGVGWLLTCNKRIHQEGGKIVLHSMIPSVSNIFKLLKLDRVIAIVNTAEAAEETVKGAMA